MITFNPSDVSINNIEPYKHKTQDNILNSISSTYFI